jgi:hypothetical protein
MLLATQALTLLYMGEAAPARALLLRSIEVDCCCVLAHHLLFFYYLRYGLIADGLPHLLLCVKFHPLYVVGIASTAIPSLHYPRHTQVSQCFSILFLIASSFYSFDHPHSLSLSHTHFLYHTHTLILSLSHTPILLSHTHSVTPFLSLSHSYCRQ